ncbi:MAG: 1-deoxy-D-xylulose-5-phosphate reductoisomerase [Candidatus Aminicenantales bacterium]
MKKSIAILGSTGSIGRSTLQVVERLSSRFKVVGLAAGRNVRLLQEQIEKFRPRVVSLEREEEADKLRSLCRNYQVEIVFGEKGAEQVAGLEESDSVVSAITGIKGLKPTIAAVRAGKRVALANKESMVVAGSFIQGEAQRSGSELIPVDSEHNGVFQCLMREKKENIRKIILTASGGPFFRTPLEEMKDKTLEEALEHPRWKMGEKVTIDSATLMNKGLELIEARWLFGVQPHQLDIVIHPQSIVHSLVELKDGSMLAQLSPTDMKIPILFALTYPEREEAILPSLDLRQVRVLEFFEADTEKFPLLPLARQALEEGESVPVALNASNEVAVQAFLERKIRFLDIYRIVAELLQSHQKRKIKSLEDILEVDEETRRKCRNLLKERL